MGSIAARRTRAEGSGIRRRVAARMRIEALETRALLAPVANPDAYAVPQSTTLQVVAPGVLGNDTPDPAAPPNTPLTPFLVSPPAHGTLALTFDGSFVYSPVPGYSGPDSFTYDDSDGTNLSNTTTVSLNVNPVNAPPVANPDTYSVSENTQFSIAGPGILGNDYSPNNPPSLPLNAQLVSGVSHGTLNLAPDGSITYTPNPNFVGADTFTYRDVDANGFIGAPTTVTLNVSHATTQPPTDIAPSLTFTTSQNKPLFVAGPGVLTNNSDPNGNSLTALVIDSTAHGTLTLSGDGSFTYTPDANFNGADSFTYEAYNGKFTSPPVTVNLIVNLSPDQPVANPDTYQATEGTTLTIPSADGVVRGVLANDFVLDGDALTAVLVNGPLDAASGGFALNPDGSFNYTPAPGFHGTDTFTYQAVDQTVTPNLKSAITTVTIDVAQAFTAPTVHDASFSTTQGFPLSVAAPGVLANDTDPNGLLLSAVLVNAPLHGGLAAERRRLVHVHAGGELQRARHFHLRGERRQGPQRDRDGQPDGQPRAGAAGRHEQGVFAAGEHDADGPRAGRAARLADPRRADAHGRPGQRAALRRAGRVRAQRRRLVYVHARGELQRGRHVQLRPRGRLARQQHRDGDADGRPRGSAAGRRQ